MLQTVMGGKNVEQVEHVEHSKLVVGLIKAIKDNGQVGSLWPLGWLTDHGLGRGKGEKLLRGLLDVGELSQKSTGEWMAP